MKQDLMLPVLAAAVTGVATAGLTTALILNGSDLGGATSDTERALHPGGATVADVTEELQDLRAQNDVLRSRIAALELRPVSQSRTSVGEFASVADLESLRDQVNALIEGESNLTTSAPVALKNQVALALEAARQDEAHQAEQRRLEKQAARLENRVSKMADWLGLNDHQATEMRAVLTQKDERDNELSRVWKETGDTQVAGQLKRDNHELHLQDVQQILDVDQYETYTTRRQTKE